MLTATSTLGCGVATDKVHVYVYKDIFVPTAFTPNNNGVNDTWYIPPLAAFNEFEISFSIDAGKLVFQLVNINKRWDGTYNGCHSLPASMFI